MNYPINEGKDTMRVIHLMSFCGNIGDVFSWSSFHELLTETCRTNVEFHCVEIRDFYRNCQKRRFDAEFLEEINKYDLFVIGGGLFFDVRWDYSHTGTTLDFSNSFIEGLRIPVILNGLGYMEPSKVLESDPVQKSNFVKFERFIRNISNRSNWFISIRNDGSFERINKRFGNDFAALFYVVPDNGFFYSKGIAKHEFNNANIQTIGFSIANDSFTVDDAAVASVNKLNEAIARVVKALLIQGKRVIFFTHIPHDIEAVYHVLKCIGAESFRKNVVLAPFNPNGNIAAKELTSYYLACDAVVAMRLHSNIIALQNVIPTVALVAQGVVSGERIKSIHSVFKLDDNIIYTDSKDVSLDEKLLNKLHQLLADPKDFAERVSMAMERLAQQRQNYINDLRVFLAR